MGDIDDMHSTTHTLCDPAEIVRAVTLLCGDGVTELRCLHTTIGRSTYPTAYFGYFDDAEKLADAVSTLTSFSGCYVTPNAVNPDLLARRSNRIDKAGRGSATQDTDIVSRRWLLIDLDAVRPHGISSTDAEHEAARETARRIYKYLCGVSSWPQPIVADSGNGSHLMYRIDLPADDGGIVKRCLTALSARFSDDNVKVDETVHNPARIWKLYGTLARKGDSTPERPHRMARVISVPDTIEVVPTHLLEALAAEVPDDQQEPRTNGHSVQHSSRVGQSFDVEDFIRQHNLDVAPPHPWNGGNLWEFRQSPMCEHHDGAAWIGQRGSGALAAGCHHNSCSWGWADLRRVLEPERPARRNGQAASGEATPSQPVAVPDPWVPFPVDVLPEPVRSIVTECAASIGCDPSYIALPLFAALAATIGNSRTIRLRRGWEEPCVLWTAIVGESGTMKSPALDAPLKPIRRAESLSIREHQQALEDHERDLVWHKQAVKDWERQGRKTGADPPTKPEEPVCLRRIVSDITVESLAVRLRDNPRGVLLCRDELAGWLRSFDQYKAGKGGDVQSWLSMHNAGNLIVDRKGGGTIYVERAAVSVCGGIQPGILRSALLGEHVENGLAARLLFAWPARRARRWTTREISPHTESDLAGLVSRLGSLDPEDIGGESDDVKPVPIDLDGDALELWASYVNQHGQEQLEHTGLLAAVWSKLEATAARLALIVHLVRASLVPSMQRIDAESLRAGIELSDWFGGEAVRMFGLLCESGEDRETRNLIDWVTARGGAVTVRDLVQGMRRFRGDTAGAEQALNKLVEAGLGVWQVTPTPTNNRREFQLSTVSTSTDSPETAEIRESVDSRHVDTGGNAKPDAVADATNQALEVAFADEQGGEQWDAI